MRRRALLIGIDYYDQFQDRKNLHGCVSDINDVQQALSRSQIVPDDSIRVLRGDIPHGSYPKSGRPMTPTRDEIISAIKAITKQSIKGDFVYFHFSGHGARLDTVYKKGGTGKDEAICCADGSIIRDVELGVLFDDMAAKGLNVLAVLDCCHSGGATRVTSDDRWAVRERAQEIIPSSIDWIGQESISNIDEEDPKMKNEHWFWRDKAYHLLAACQPYELAGEFADDNNRKHGVLTFYLVECLNLLGPMAFTTTYRHLIQLLEVRCRSEDFARSQCPVLYGDQGKIIFDLAADMVRPLDKITVALVLKVEGAKVVINRGSVDGVSVGDIYHLSPQPGSQATLEVQVAIVKDFEAYATANGGQVQDMHVFWTATLIKSANEGHVALTRPYYPSSAYDRLKEEWKNYVDSAYPLQLHEENNFIGADFHVCLKQSNFRILDSNRQLVPNLPMLPADCPLKMTKKVAATLVHLHRYSRFKNLAPAEWEELEQNWDFQVVRKPVPPNTKAVARYRIAFKNNSRRQRLFISIFNLAPDWSVQQIIPQPGLPGESVEPGSWIDPFTIGIEIPTLLQSSRPETMTDTLKVLITTEPHDFSHYELPGIEKAGVEWYRNARANIQGRFAVNEVVLTHTINP